MARVITSKLNLDLISSSEIRGLVDVATELISSGEEFSKESLRRRYLELSIDDDGRFERIFNDERFVKLLSLRMRLSRLDKVPELAEHFTFIHTIIRYAIETVTTSMMETIIAAPDTLTFDDKRRFLNTMLESAEKLRIPISGQIESATPAGVLEAATYEERIGVESLAELLSRYPEAMHERIKRQWRLEQFKEIKEQEGEIEHASS